MSSTSGLAMKRSPTSGTDARGALARRRASRSTPRRRPARCRCPAARAAATRSRGRRAARRIARTANPLRLDLDQRDRAFGLAVGVAIGHRPDQPARVADVGDDHVADRHDRARVDPHRRRLAGASVALLVDRRCRCRSAPAAPARRSSDSPAATARTSTAAGRRGRLHRLVGADGRGDGAGARRARDQLGCRAAHPPTRPTRRPRIETETTPASASGQAVRPASGAWFISCPLSCAARLLRPA